MKKKKKLSTYNINTNHLNYLYIIYLLLIYLYMFIYKDRYSALQGQPLQAYFKGETLHERPDGSLFKSNMYLAEDRILCFELVAKKGAKYLLKYVRAAKAETDVPDNIPEFISQRRRWLNGSFFASLYSTYNWREVYNTEHSSIRKFVFGIEFVYNIFSLLFSWFGLANFFLTFYFLAHSVIDNSEDTNLTFMKNFGPTLFLIMETIYAYAIICIFISSLGNRPQGSRLLYLACIILFAVVMVFILILTILTIYQVLKVKELSKNSGDPDRINKSNKNVYGMFFSLLATYGLYFISSLIHLQPAHMFTSFIQYMLLLPSFINILMVYAFCNTHDVSWGTKGSTDDASSKLGSITAKPGENIHVELPSKENINSHYEKLLPELKKGKIEEPKTVDHNQAIQDGKQNFRTYLVLFWIFCNSILLILGLTVFNRSYSILNKEFNPYLDFIFYSVLLLSGVRFIGSTLYIIQEIIS
jgi:chitin synthase